MIIITVIRRVATDRSGVFVTAESTRHSFSSNHLRSTHITEVCQELGVPNNMYLTAQYCGSLVTDTGGLWTGFDQHI